MSARSLTFERVSFAYDGSECPLFTDLAFQASFGWTGIVGANGSGKTTILRLATGLLTPQSGTIRRPDVCCYCPQRTENPPQDLGPFFAGNDAESHRLRGRLGIEDDWVDRWSTLSHGERKRIQIGIVLWHAPDLLALDEPTNHVDHQTRVVLAQALRSHRGVGILVSHDRELLDQLSHQCLFVEPPFTVLRPGKFTKGQEAQTEELDALKRAHKTAKQHRGRLERESKRRREKASRADRMRSKRGLAKGDHDGRAKINQARVSGKDAVAGKLLRQLTGRLRQAQSLEQDIRIQKEHHLGIWLSEERSKRPTLLRRDPCTLALGPEKTLEVPTLAVGSSDRVSISGPNGAGKSTLIRALIDDLNLEADRVAYLPQEIDAADSISFLDEMRGLSQEDLGKVLSLVSRLGTRPERLLASEIPSPGEIRKILLARSILLKPHLIVLDEPTNHLDLPSILCLEQALKDCPCALLLVSHDEEFLQALTTTRWVIHQTAEKNRLELEVLPQRERSPR